MTCSGGLANVCRDSDKGLNPIVAGKVIYSLGGENCLGESCYSQVVKEHDRCLDKRKLLEFACQQDVVIEKEISCEAGRVCHRGACVNK